MRIGIDLMGGDTSPDHLFEAVLSASSFYHSSPITFLVLATPEVVHRISSMLPSNVEYYVAPDMITMNDEPLLAVRHKKRSSLVLGIRLVKKRKIDAFISVGNTGALIAAATLSLPLKPGVKRPALLANLPTAKGFVSVLDVGGNVSCKAHHLVQFAQMGADYQRHMRGIESPRVGLLNIGVESQKGTAEVRSAYQILKELDTNSSLVFMGNIEAREVMKGNIDVLVTDGFSGNVLLKSIEGASTFILQFLERSHKDAEWLQEINAHFNSEEYPGAILCGIEGIVVKCHGNASPRALYQGIKGAIQLANRPPESPQKVCSLAS